MPKIKENCGVVGAPILVDFAKDKPLGAADAVSEKKK